MKKKIYLCITLIALSGCNPKEAPKASDQPKVEAAQPEKVAYLQYPDELLGKFTEDKGKNSCLDAGKMEKAVAWPGFEITETASAETESACKPTKISQEGDKYVINETCDRHESWGDDSPEAEKNRQKSVTTYVLAGKTLKTTSQSADGKISEGTFALCKPKVPVACNKDEIQIFKAVGKVKGAALCASPRNGDITKVELRFGSKADAEVVLKATPENGQKFYVDAATVSPRANSQFVWFSKGDKVYSVATCMGGDCAAEAGVLAINGSKADLTKFGFKDIDSVGFDDKVFVIDENYKFKSKTPLFENKAFPQTPANKSPEDLFSN